jgi:hypothetical protein
MKKIFALALSLMLAAPALTMAQAPAAAPAAEKKNGAVLTPDESKFEFGTVKQGDVVDHTFTFRNTGTEPLVISNVAASCGCTTPEYTKDPIQRGATGKITARFNTAGKMGQQNKTLTVNSNNVGGDVYLTLSGTIAEPAATATAAAPAAATEVKAAPAPATEKSKVKKGEAKKMKK